MSIGCAEVVGSVFEAVGIYKWVYPFAAPEYVVNSLMVRV